MIVIEKRVGLLSDVIGDVEDMVGMTIADRSTRCRVADLLDGAASRISAAADELRRG